nr:immunoglobulin heavy chain junction region [Macaca mulatta]MOW94516.1 immunoglobulin heavy chain junction region [Macaca mulatta]MOW95079.1 immunoglobulin heavy chain junction region [Macaca mulatta]MOW95317.1 immunoglobulin heavy chain junction region [Macaca mulatta]MOW95462.1 immunoglobulin heavy chain junction region [Macaca mulatta]
CARDDYSIFQFW